MAYDAVDIDGWDSTKPDGATEKINILDNAIREVKKCVENTFGVGHDTETGAHLAGEVEAVLFDTKANFPAAGIEGALACATDEDNLLYYDSGAAWVATGIYLGGRGYTALSADTTLDATHDFVTITAAAANRVITFPVATDGKIYTVMRIDGSGNTVTLTPNGAETFNGAASETLALQYSYRTYIGVAGTGWLLVASSTVFDSDTLDGLHASELNFPYVLVKDVKAQGTNGGTFTSGDWRVRDLNTEEVDSDSKCTLASNQITLSAGTYRCRISCPATLVDGHQARLRNVTDGTTLVVGTNSYSDSAYSHETRSEIVGQFTIGASKALEVQHRCESTRATYGMGGARNWTSEVYTIAEFWKIPS